MSPPLVVQADNALGSAYGDVDDAFALAALFRGGVEIAALSSVFGNTPEDRAFENNDALARLAGWKGPRLHGARRDRETATEIAKHLVANPGSRVLALGPLTDVAAALYDGARPAEVIFVGANLSSRGRWPPFWPFEYNLVKDRAATSTVFASSVPLVVVPLDVAKTLRIGRADLRKLSGPLGAHLREGSRRWHRRALFALALSVPVWDLVAAMWLVDPSLFRIAERRATAHPSGWIEFGGGRVVRVVAGFDPAAVWRRFASLLP